MKNLIFLVLLNLPFVVFAQEEENKEQKLTSIITAEIGAGFSLGGEHLTVGQLSDHLIYYGKSNYNITPIDVSWYFLKKWGIALRIQMNWLEESQRDVSRLNQEVEERLGSRYFYDPKRSFAFDNKSAEKLFMSYFVGVKYKTNYKKYSITTSLYYGATELELDSYSTGLKEKGENEIIEYSIRRINESNEGGNYESQGTLLTGIQVGYPLNSYLELQAGLKYFYTKPDFKYTETIEAQLSGETTTNTYRYNQSISMYQVGISLVFNVDVDHPF